MSVGTAGTEDAKLAAKREKEAARRAEIKAVKDEFAAREAELPSKLDADARKRALDAPAGLRKDAFRIFVETGMDSKAQAEVGRSEEKKERKVRAAKDPEAAALAVKAAESAPGIKSKFRPLEGRQVLDLFEIAPNGARISVTRKGEDAPVDFAKKQLVTFRDGGDFENKAEVRKSISTLGTDTRLWGRKFAAFILVAAAE